MKILALSSSNSKNSINKLLIRYAAEQLAEHSINIIDINNFEMPIYNIDLEEDHGIPPAASKLFALIGEHDALIISHAEHNGTYTTVFKNVLDWLSRIDRNVYQGKKLILLATSPGPGGASNVLEFATKSTEFFGGKLIASFSLPNFYENFDQDKIEISHTGLNKDFISVLAKIGD